MITHSNGFSRWRLAGAGLAAALLALPTAGQGVLFTDDFETDTAANWTVLDGAAAETPADFGVAFNYDYSQKGIPAAPNSAGGTTRGVWLTVNKNDDTAAVAGVSIFPKDKTFSGNYALRFDMWLAYNGPAYGGTGSTEFATFGINHNGTLPVWASAPDSDGGVFFAVTGDAGAAFDYRAYIGSPGGPPLRPTGAAAGFADRDNNGVLEEEAVSTSPVTSPLRFMFPAPPFGTPEVPGKRWVQGEVRQQDGKLTWALNGYVIAQRDYDGPEASGNVMLGNMDIFASIADPRAENFVLYDNVRVVNLDAPGAALPQVNVEATAAAASEPDVPAVFTISRTGDTTQALQVPFFLYGTAIPGVDYGTNNLTGGGTNFIATIPAGASSVALTLTPINDLLGEDEENIRLALISTPGTYEVGLGMIATATLANVGGGTAIDLTVADGQTYERDAEDAIRVIVTRAGDLASDLTVNLGYSGTATAATDFEGAAATITIPATLASAELLLTPKDDATAEGDESLVVEVKPGAGYILGLKPAATVTIRDDEGPATAPIFADNFDTDSSANWTTAFSAANNITDFSALFAYDYSADSIPAAPHSAGSTKGLKVTVNKDDATATGAAALNVYAKNQNFTGNYVVRFDMWINADLNSGGSTEHAIMGVNHSGTVTNRASFPGGDGLWFAAGTDGSTSALYRSYVGNPNGNPTSETIAETAFTSYFTAPPFLAPGAVSGHWVDGEMSQVDGVVRLKFNGVTIFTRTNTTAFTAGTLMLGHADLFNSVGSPQNFTVFDNVRVYQLSEPVQPIALAQPTISGTDLVLNWTGGAGTFVVQGKLNLNDPGWIDLKTTTERTAKIPLASPLGFFRVQDGAAKTVTLYKASLDAAQEGPSVVSSATGVGLLAVDGTTATYVVGFHGLVGTLSNAHVHGPAPAGQSAPPLFNLVFTPGLREGVIAGQATIDATAAGHIAAGNTYFNLHTSSFGGGEIRGQILAAP